MIVADDLLFNFVESPFFAVVLRMARLNAPIPGRLNIRSLLHKQRENLLSALFKDHGPNTKVSLALDCWSSPNKLIFMGINAYYISEVWKHQEVLFGFEQVIRSHIGENLAHIVKNVLVRFNLIHPLFNITADDTSNNGTLRRLLQTTF